MTSVHPHVHRAYVRAHRLSAGYITAPHGTLSTYTNYMCRCDPCRAAKAEQSRERYKRLGRGR